MSVKCILTGQTPDINDIGAVPVTRKINNKALDADVTLTASDVGALPDSTTIPSKTSDLTNDSGFITSAPVTSVAEKTGAVTLDKSDVGLGNVDNTSDADKPVSTATQTALDGKLSLSGGDMTGHINFGISSSTGSEPKDYQVGRFKNLKLATGRTVDSCLGLTGYWRDADGNLNIGSLETSDARGNGSVFVSGGYVVIGTYQDGQHFNNPQNDDNATVEIHGLRTPTATYDAANKAYVDTQVSTKQSSITANGILKGDGAGNITSVLAATFTELGDIDDIVTVQSADEVSY